MHYQLAEAENQLVSYVSQQRITAVAPAVAWGGSTVGASVAGGAWSHFAAAGMVTTCIAVSSTLLISLSAALSLAAFGAAYAEMSHWKEEFVPTKNPRVALQQLYALLNAHTDTEYSLSNWNCNHFADYVMEGLARGVDD